MVCTRLLSLFMIFKGLDALRYRKVLLSTIFSNDEEASCLIELWVRAHFECLEVLHLCIYLLMEAKEFLNEVSFGAFQAITILPQIQDSS